MHIQLGLVGIGYKHIAYLHVLVCYDFFLRNSTKERPPLPDEIRNARQEMAHHFFFVWDD